MPKRRATEVYCTNLYHTKFVKDMDSHQCFTDLFYISDKLLQFKNDSDAKATKFWIF